MIKQKRVDNIPHEKKGMTSKRWALRNKESFFSAMFEVCTNFTISIPGNTISKNGGGYSVVKKGERQSGFSFFVVLFILLIIVGTAFSW